MTILHGPAQVFLENGYSVFPTNSDKSPAVQSWSRFRKKPMSVSEIKSNFNGAPSIAIVTGSASGNLELIDVDDETLFDSMVDKIRSAGLLDRVLLEKSPHGYHVIYKSELPVDGNQKLSMGWEVVEGPGEYEWNERTWLSARKVNGHGWIVSPCLIETRGEGGYFLCSPSPGYEVIEGAWASLVPITVKERETLLNIGRSFDRRPDDIKVSRSLVRSGSGVESKPKIKRPGDLYNELWRDTVPDLLLECGWTQVGTTPKSTLWRRPGKTHGQSGELFNDNGNFKCYSTNVPELSPCDDNGVEKEYSPLSLLVNLKFGEESWTDAISWIASNYQVTSTVEEVIDVLQANPSELDNAYNYSGLEFDVITDIALELGLNVDLGSMDSMGSMDSGDGSGGRIMVKYDPCELNRVVKEVDEGLSKIKGDWGYYGLMGTVGYIENDHFIPYNTNSLELRIEQSIKFKVPAKKDGKFVNGRCPTHVVNKVLSYPGTGVDVINGFSQNPLITRDGTIYGLEHGFENGVYFTHSGGFSVSNLSWKECYDELVSLLCNDILFNADRRELLTAAYIGFLLTAVARPGFSGGCPGVLITANEAGTGKSTAIQIVLGIVTGSEVNSIPWGKHEEEREKKLVANLTAGSQVVLHDNIALGTELNDSVYAEALTAGSFVGRRLGKSEMIHINCRNMFVFGGNSVTMSVELSRRLLCMQLTTPVYKPASREVRDRDIVRNSIRNRKQIISYVLRMLQLGANMDKKALDNVETQDTGVGNFWDALIKNPILVETGIDISGAMGDNTEMSSQEADRIETTVELLFQLYGQEGMDSFSARHLYNWINSTDETTDDLTTQVRDAFIDINGFAWKSTKSLGKALRMIIERPTESGNMIVKQRKSEKSKKAGVYILRRGDT